jgi:glycosyltransferase involved in cell wall biosynthesis
MRLLATVAAGCGRTVAPSTSVPTSDPSATAPQEGHSGRLGVYLDDVYWVFPDDGRERVSTDRSFLLFVYETGTAFESLSVFGRAVHSAEPADYVLPDDVRLLRLPHYSNLRQVLEVLRATGGTLTAFWRGLGELDRLWVFGPHPFAVVLVALAVVRRKQVVLGVRQDTVRLYQARLASRWSPALLAARAVEGAYRLFSRRLRTTVQGSELAERYGGARPGMLTMTESVVRAAEVVAEPIERDYSGEVVLLTVGRFETEKNPLLLVRAIAELERERPGVVRLTWVGRGPLEDEVRELAAELGVDDRIEFLSYVAFGPDLLDLYRRANAFVHVSLSEGVPKVLLEALASSTPIVATDVGGVRVALEDGAAGLLVPPDDLDALVSAIRRILDEPELRSRLVSEGLRLARELTLEAQVEQVVRFIAAPSLPAPE